MFNGDLGELSQTIPGVNTTNKQETRFIDFEMVMKSLTPVTNYKIRLAYAPWVFISLREVSSQLSSYRLLVQADVCWSEISSTAITRAPKANSLLGELYKPSTMLPHIGTARKTYLIERFSDLLWRVEEKQQAVSETVTYQVPEQSPTLTEEKTGSIPAMIGITDTDLKEIFGK